jgi:hypothetical protein
MDQRKTQLERAFEIAGLGTYTAVEDICARLKREGYACEQLDGPSIRKQLREIARKARISKARPAKVRTGNTPKLSRR